MSTDPKPRQSQYLFAYLGSGSIFALNLLALRMSRVNLGQDGFAAYAIGRRTINILMMLALPALMLSVTRLVAQAEEKSRAQRFSTLVSGHLLSLSLLVPLVLFSWFYPEETTLLTFGSREFSSLALPLTLTIVGLCQVALAASFLNGILWIGTSTMLTTVSVGIIPLGCILSDIKEPAQLFQRMALLGVLFALAANLTIFAALLYKGDRVSSFSKSLKALAKFSLPRIPGAAGLMALTSLPIILLARETSDTLLLSAMALGGSVISAGTLLVAPLSTVMLPDATKLIRDGRSLEVHQAFRRYLKIMLPLSFALSLISIPMLKPALSLWIDPELGRVSFLLIWVVFTTIPLSIHRAFSSLLDAARSRAFNSEHLALAVAVQVALYFGLRTWNGLFAVLLSFLCGSTLLAGLTLWRVDQVLRVECSDQ